MNGRSLGLLVPMPGKVNIIFAVAKSYELWLYLIILVNIQPHLDIRFSLEVIV